jgi:hypothetical protein
MNKVSRKHRSEEAIHYALVYSDGRIILNWNLRRCDAVQFEYSAIFWSSIWPPSSGQTERKLQFRRRRISLAGNL